LVWKLDRYRNGFYAAMRQAGLTVELLETRHVRNAFMPVKTDRKDACGIPELMRLGWFRPVHCKLMEAQKTRAMLTPRNCAEGAFWKLEPARHSARLRPEGRQDDPGRARGAYWGAAALLSVRAVLRRQLDGFEKVAAGDRAHRYACPAADDNAAAHSSQRTA
jgi:transposase